MQRFSWTRWLKTLDRPARRGRRAADRPRLALTDLERRDNPAPFTVGDLVVYRVGDGSAALTTAATPVFLDEITTAGGPVQSIAMPTTASGTNHRLTASGSGFGDGLMNNSADGRFLITQGYDAAVGTAAVTGTVPATNPRVVAIVGNNGVVDTSTAMTDSASNIRESASTDGVVAWTVGASAGPIRLANVGTTGTSTSLSSVLSSGQTLSSLLGVQVFNNQLYVGGSVAGLDGLASVGTGLPTTTGQTTTVLPGFPTTGTSPFPTPRGFVFADANTVYVADSRTNGSGGVQKWTFDGSFWNLQYNVVPAATEGMVDIVGDFSGANPIIYGVTAPASSATPDRIVKIVDGGSAAASTVTVLATSATNQYFRGIAFSPKPLGATADTVTLAGGAAAPVGSPVTFTATVTAATAATGWITFQSAGTTLAVVPLTPATGTTATAQFTTSSLPVGVDHVTAVYGGSTTYLKGSGSFDQTVTGTNTTTIVTSNAVGTPTTAGVSITFTATVSPASGTTAPTGTVTFFDNGVPINASPITLTAAGSTGTAQVTVITGSTQSGTNLVPGSHTVSAVFTPTGTFVGSTGDVVQGVRPNAFGAGDVLVYRVGDGTTALTVNGNTIFVDEYTTAVGQTVPVQSIAMPTKAVAGGNQSMIGNPQQTPEGQLSLSGDGQWVFTTGYDAPLGGASGLNTSPSATIPRTIGRIKFDGTIDTSMALTDLADAGSVRGVASPDGSRVYATGATGGVRFVATYTPGVTTSLQIDDASNNTNGATGALTLNSLGAYFGQLYVSDSANGGLVKVATVGTGLPTTAGQTDNILPGLPTGTGNSPGFPVGFFFAHLQSGPVVGADTVYIADDGANFFGGTITKWSLVGNTWTLNDTIASGGSSVSSPVPSFDFVNGTVTGANVNLFATYGNGGSGITGPGLLFSMADTGGYNAAIPDHTINTLASVPVGSNKTFRGVSVVPKQAATPATVSGVQINDGSAQRSEVKSIKVSFSEAVNFTGGNANAAAAFTLSRVGGGNVGLAAAVAADNKSVTLTWTGTAETDPVSAQNGGQRSLADGVFHLSIASGAVTSVATGLALDGDNNGTPGGAYNSPTDTAAGGAGQLRLLRLFGDGTGNGLVDLNDLAMFRGSFNSTGPNPPYLAFFDADNSNQIDLIDLSEFRLRFNVNLLP